jgi:hypothetical protein
MAQPRYHRILDWLVIQTTASGACSYDVKRTSGKTIMPFNNSLPTVHAVGLVTIIT